MVQEVLDERPKAVLECDQNPDDSQLESKDRK